MGHEPRSEGDTDELLIAIAMFEDLYERVASRVGVSQAMVGRVVRGEQTSVEISEAVHSELRAIRDYLNRKPNAVDGF
jgi:hypothetical protein